MYLRTSQEHAGHRNGWTQISLKYQPTKMLATFEKHRTRSVVVHKTRHLRQTLNLPTCLAATEAETASRGKDTTTAWMFVKENSREFLFWIRRTEQVNRTTQQTLDSVKS